MRSGSVRTYRNPVIPGFHPDPSICRVGDDFYLVTSSFEYFPGVPIFHSRNLTDWRLLGHVLTRPSQLRLQHVRSSGGIYAPTLRYSRGRFYVVTTHVGGGGNFYVSAKRPEGPWSDPVWLDQEGIDPSFFFDGDTVYYTRNGKGADFDHPVICQATVDLKTGKIVGKMRRIWSGTGGIWPEAPHLYKVGSTYYLMAAEGGTAYGHSEIVARSSKPFGPYEGYPKNPILSHRSLLRHPIQATGHADLVELADGTWWAVLLGIRPTGRRHHLGRETFLAPVTWTRDGWPILGRDGRIELEMQAPPLESYALPPAGRHVRDRGQISGSAGASSTLERDHFETATLDPIWSFLRNPSPRDWSLTTRPGWLRLLGSPVTLDDVDSPALVVRRQQHFALRSRAALDFHPRFPNEEAGLTVRADENFHYDLAITRADSGREATLRRRVRGESQIVGRCMLEEGELFIEVRANEKTYSFFAGVHEPLAPLGSLPTRTLSAETIGASGAMCFTGVCIGVYATGNGRPSSVPADFDWFDYVPGDAPLSL
jgi:xylan 1,4-beta-xylosidase